MNNVLNYLLHFIKFLRKQNGAITYILLDNDGNLL